jgi:hypothetical protein
MCFFFYETENEYPFGTRNTTDGKINWRISAKCLIIFSTQIYEVVHVTSSLDPQRKAP